MPKRHIKYLVVDDVLADVPDGSPEVGAWLQSTRSKLLLSR